MNGGGGPSSAPSPASSRSRAEYEGDHRPHILAIDDNLVDRKLIEKPLLNSSCKGNIFHRLEKNVAAGRNRADIPCNFQSS